MIVTAFTAAAPAVIAQRRPRVRTIGFLGPGRDEMLWLGRLRELGWIEGRNLAVERRAELDFEALQPAADELVRLGVDVIVTDGTNAARAAKKATSSIPIVMAAAGDPVGAGLVSALSHPDGNITGYSILAAGMAIKRAELVHELVPAARRVGVVMSSSNALYDLLWTSADDAYRSLGLNAVFIDAISAEQVARALADAALGIDAVEIDIDLASSDAAVLVAAATKRMLPVVGSGRTVLDAGGVLVFDVDRIDQARRVAAIIDKVLRGTAPGIIPIEQPASFTLLLNARAAKALGLAVPRAILLRADEVIQ